MLLSSTTPPDVVFVPVVTVVLRFLDGWVRRRSRRGSGPERWIFRRQSLSRDVYSLNVPVPSDVARLASSLARELPDARARRRNEHTLVCKRLDPSGGADAVHRLDARVREAVAGTPPFAVRVAGVDQFPEAPTGSSPVVYLAVESPGLRRVHERLCEVFDPVDGLEGGEYTPHVTVARGGSPERASALCERTVDRVEWTVSELQLYHADHHQSVRTLSLPA
jgi:2'-5' RNA ligase